MADTINKPAIFLAFANDRDDTIGYLRNLPDEARRLPRKSDDAFRARAERTAKYAKLLIDAALANNEIRALIADARFPEWTEAGERSNPTVRID